jgi:hypothetical protein
MILIPTTPRALRRTSGAPLPPAGYPSAAAIRGGGAGPLKGGRARGRRGGGELRHRGPASRPLRGSAGGCFNISQVFFCLANKGETRVFGGFLPGGGLTLHDVMPYL